MELIKETNCSENDTFSAAAMPLHQLFSANSPNVPQNLNELSKSLLTLINSASTASNAPTGAQSVHNQSTNSDLTKSSASTSNDESVDSQPCNGDEGNTKRTRCRRRKPQKTIRMANDAPTTPPLANGTDADGNTRSHKNSESSFEDTSQTHSMDLSNYSASHDTFSNGKLTNSIYPTTVAKPMNGFASMSMARYSDPINSMPSASNHLKSTFNTDDLVKKVEEIVKCNSNDAPPIPTNFSATRNGDENKDFNGQLSNGGDKNCSNSQPVIAGHTSPERRLNGNENGTDLIASQETDTKGGKALDEVPLMASAEVKLPDITLPMANSTPKHNHVDDVENHLEKMFAHVDSAAASSPNATETTANVEGASQNDSENQNSQTQNDANSESALATKSNVEQGTSSAEPTPSTSQSKPARSRKRPAANSKKKGSSAPKRLNKSNAKGANNGKNAAKNTSKNNKNAKSNRSTEDIKKTKEELAAAEAVAKFRGPYIQVQRDGSECIVNAPITEEVTEKQNKIRKAVVPGVSGARSRVSGLHVSTLSNKYDTITTDASWMCVFCKLGPHKHGLGDLFGPFILSTDSKEFQESQFDPSEDAFRSQRTSSNMVQVKGGMKVVPAKASTSAAATANNAGNVSTVLHAYPIQISLFTSISFQSSCRKKRKITESADTPEPTIQVPDIFYGMTKVSETAYEVWVHEDCVVWANGVYLVGATIIGLDAAVWGTSRHKCSICERFGAGIACLKRGCRAEAHVPCASRGQWSLNEAKFQTHCKLHAIAECDTVEKANATARPSENCE